MKVQKVIVVGGGAAGLMAAGQAALDGAETVLLEKMKRPGRKICISGKGRCNLTNIAELAEFIDHFGKTGRFLRQPFTRFFSRELMAFFTDLGLDLVTERGGRVFPASGKAPEVLAVFLAWLEHCGVRIETSSPVDALLVADGRVKGVVCKGQKIAADAVILTTGGASYPATGSSGDGYALAQAAGHTLVPIRPALVPLEIAGSVTAKMAELNLRNVNVRMYIDGKRKRQEFGELVFTKTGLSGPVILTMSGDVVDALRNDRKVELSIDLKPALDEQKLDARLIRDLTTRHTEEMDSILRGLLAREMVPVCLELIGIDPRKIGGQLSGKERTRLRIWLKDFRLQVKGYRSFTEAIVTAGGIDTREVDSRTMESKKTKGLYIAGELLDIQGDTGGYNLQAAFSTGWLAGKSAAEGS